MSENHADEKLFSIRDFAGALWLMATITLLLGLTLGILFGSMAWGPLGVSKNEVEPAPHFIWTPEP